MNLDHTTRREHSEKPLKSRLVCQKTPFTPEIAWYLHHPHKCERHRSSSAAVSLTEPQRYSHELEKYLLGSGDISFKILVAYRHSIR